MAGTMDGSLFIFLVFCFCYVSEIGCFYLNDGAGPSEDGRAFDQLSGKRLCVADFQCNFAEYCDGHAILHIHPDLYPKGICQPTVSNYGLCDPNIAMCVEGATCQLHYHHDDQEPAHSPVAVYPVYRCIPIIGERHRSSKNNHARSRPDSATFEKFAWASMDHVRGSHRSYDVNDNVHDGWLEEITGRDSYNFDEPPVPPTERGENTGAKEALPAIIKVITEAFIKSITEEFVQLVRNTLSDPAYKATLQLLAQGKLLKGHSQTDMNETSLDDLSYTTETHLNESHSAQGHNATSLSAVKNDATKSNDEKTKNSDEGTEINEGSVLDEAKHPINIPRDQDDNDNQRPADHPSLLDKGTLSQLERELLEILTSRKDKLRNN